jgi:flagellar assembly factor FliW
MTLKLQTTRFGDIEISETGIITFLGGLPGFEDLTKFVFLQESEDALYAHMQSVEDEKVAFVIVNPFIFVDSYDFEISTMDEHDLRIEAPEDVQTWVIMNVSDTIQTSSINLIAPLVVNTKNKLAKQVILHNTNYEAKHMLGRLGG